MITYTIDPSEQLIRAMMTGSNSFTDIVDYLDRVLGDPEYKPHFNCLFQIAPKAQADVMHHLEEFKQIIERLVSSGNGVKWAVVVPNKLQMLLAEIIMEWVKLDPVIMKYFSDEESALTWLSGSEQDAAHPPA